MGEKTIGNDRECGVPATNRRGSRGNGATRDGWDQWDQWDLFVPFVLSVPLVPSHRRTWLSFRLWEIKVAVENRVARSRSQTGQSVVPIALALSNAAPYDQNIMPQMKSPDGTK